MPQTPTTCVCSHCNGFAIVRITTGTTPDGHHLTLPAACPACHGTGHTTTRTTVKAVAK
ncbi:hypothetical protein NX801_24440 [Streptomyces sp. LP05-1]|uniref:Molecular chaperone DnaJ n=1 Tax=Streptomyces pyxinae TaxID=2970734 RepID=A0ABT2CNV2_9ACTN|nr:hypothetical protein [Streptomyces sp. LP05-1]MCS0638747.1 hypothetical protein [Streptomyces sp. LP05-1]